MNSNLKMIPLPLKSQSSKIYIGDDTLAQIGTLLQSESIGKKGVLITNPTVRKFYAEIVMQSCQDIGLELHLIEVPDGEKYKTLETISGILDQMLAFRLERNDIVLALGGGVIGDMAAFAASIYLRGIPVVQIPTTLLSQVDSSIGGKTGVNHVSGKNLIGTFYQPLFTCIDPQTLMTLPDREIRCGLAEIVKYGIIQNPKLFQFLEQNAAVIYNGKEYTRNIEIWTYLIAASCQEKAAVVIQDETEQNLRAILNFGHTIGHAIESAFQYSTYLHGEAVAIGIKGASRIAFESNLIDATTLSRIEMLLSDLGFRLAIQKINPNKLIQFLVSDKKIKEGKLRFVLPERIGKVTIQSDIPSQLIQTVIAELILP